MEKIIANLPDMLAVANSITSFIEDFRAKKEKTIQASQELSQGWEGTAAQKYLDRMNEYAKWMEDMANVLEDYPVVLKETKARYEEADRW